MNKIEEISVLTEKGEVLVNTTPHALTFQDTDGDLLTIPSSVQPGQRTGWAVVNATPQEQPIPDDPELVRTVFAGNEDGQDIINALLAAAKAIYPGKTVRLIGSLAAANAYKEIVGMIPAPGFERVPPDKKRMRTDKFNVGDCY